MSKYAEATGSTIAHDTSVMKYFDQQKIGSWGFTDLAGLDYDRYTGHLIALSQETEKVVELTMGGNGVHAAGGKIIQSWDLSTLSPMTQPEGVALARRPGATQFFVASEQSELYRFQWRYVYSYATSAREQKCSS